MRRIVPVISGSAAEIAEAQDDLHRAGVETRELNVSHAFHSPLMDPILDEFEARAREIAYQPLAVPLVPTSAAPLSQRRCA
jgi:acyl transferase domain-containing protein